MNEKLVYAGLFIAIVVAALAIGVAGMTMLELNEIHDIYDWRTDQEFTDWRNANFVSEGEWAHHNAQLNQSFVAIALDLDKAGLSISTLQNKFIIVEHTNAPAPITTPDSLAKCAADFDLKTLKITGEFEDRFQPTQTVFIRGDYKEGIIGDYKITKGSNELKSRNMQTSSDGSFLGTFNDAQDQITGQYTAEFQLGGLSDCITFYIE